MPLPYLEKDLTLPRYKIAFCTPTDKFAFVVFKCEMGCAAHRFDRYGWAREVSKTPTTRNN
jgi:hypothetical protein